MRINHRYSATIDEVLAWARERLAAEIPGESLDQLLALVRAIRVGDEQYTVATLAKALRRDVGSVENDLDCLERLRLVRLDWADRLPATPDRLSGWDDGSILYYPPPPNRREITIQDDLELFGLILEFCRFRFGRSSADAEEAVRRRQRKELLVALFEEVRRYEDLIRVEPDREQLRIDCAPQAYAGEGRDLLFLLDLLRQPEIADMDVDCTRGVTRGLRSGSLEPWATVRVEMRWCPEGEGFVPLWRAIKRVWPMVWLEWTHPDLCRKGLEVIGDEEAFRRWLTVPVPSAGGRMPLEIVTEEHGAETFLSLLSTFGGGAAP